MPTKPLTKAQEKEFLGYQNDMYGVGMNFNHVLKEFEWSKLPKETLKAKSISGTLGAYEKKNNPKKFMKSMKSYFSN